MANHFFLATLAITLALSSESCCDRENCCIGGAFCGLCLCGICACGTISSIGGIIGYQLPQVGALGGAQLLCCCGSGGGGRSAFSSSPEVDKACWPCCVTTIGGGAGSSAGACFGLIDYATQIDALWPWGMQNPLIGGVGSVCLYADIGAGTGCLFGSCVTASVICCCRQRCEQLFFRRREARDALPDQREPVRTPQPYSRTAAPRPPNDLAHDLLGQFAQPQRTMVFPTFEGQLPTGWSDWSPQPRSQNSEPEQREPVRTPQPYSRTAAPRTPNDSPQPRSQNSEPEQEPRTETHVRD